MTVDIIRVALAICLPLFIFLWLLYEIYGRLSEIAAESHQIARFLERLAKAAEEPDKVDHGSRSPSPVGEPHLVGSGVEGIEDHHF